MSRSGAQGERLPGHSEPSTTSTKLSPFRKRILEEAKAANSTDRRKRTRTWTKRPKYGHLQSTLDLKAGMNPLRPSKKPPVNIHALSPENFVAINGPSICSNEDATLLPPSPEEQLHNEDMCAWDNVGDQHMPTTGELDRIMLELDEIIQQSNERPRVSEESEGWGSEDVDAQAQTSWSLMARDWYIQSSQDTATPVDSRPRNLLLKPDSRSISQEQLAAEVKSIYARLTMVEEKCIHVDRARAMAPQDAESENKLSNDHWQALSALHRTLLYEHHDFFLATQHPSASPALRGLATKYGMPARMWRHAIHSFLEILRRNIDVRSGQMVGFLFTVWQMMDMLQENVPGMADEWKKIEKALTEFQNLIYDLCSDTPYDFPVSSRGSGGASSSQTYLQYLSEKTSALNDPWIDQHDMQFEDTYYANVNTIPESYKDDRSWFPQHVTHTLTAWLYMGQTICSDDFNIFAKVFAILAIAAQPFHFISTLV